MNVTPTRAIILEVLGRAFRGGDLPIDTTVPGVVNALKAEGITVTNGKVPGGDAIDAIVLAIEAVVTVDSTAGLSALAKGYLAEQKAATQASLDVLPSTEATLTSKKAALDAVTFI